MESIASMPGELQRRSISGCLRAQMSDRHGPLLEPGHTHKMPRLPVEARHKAARSLPDGFGVSLTFDPRSVYRSLLAPLPETWIRHFSRFCFRRFETRSPFDKKFTFSVIFVFDWAARLAYSCPIRKEASLQNL